MSKWYISKQVKSVTKVKKEFIFCQSFSRYLPKHWIYQWHLSYQLKKLFEFCKEGKNQKENIQAAEK